MSMNPDANPFAVLSFIVAPAMLTNASTVLVLSTSNRLARAVDRARQLAAQLESPTQRTPQAMKLLVSELKATQRRMVMLVRALKSIYVALGGFALATLLSLLGAALVPLGLRTAILTLEAIAIVAGAIAVVALVRSSTLLVRESRIVVGVFRQRARQLAAELAERERELDGK